MANFHDHPVCRQENHGFLCTGCHKTQLLNCIRWRFVYCLSVHRTKGRGSTFLWRAGRHPLKIHAVICHRTKSVVISLRTKPQATSSRFSPARIFIRPLLHEILYTCTRINDQVQNPLSFWRRNYFFLILAHPVYKMWIIKWPNKLALWNKLHFEEKNRRV